MAQNSASLDETRCFWEHFALCVIRENGLKLIHGSMYVRRVQEHGDKYAIIFPSLQRALWILQKMNAEMVDAWRLDCISREAAGSFFVKRGAPWEVGSDLVSTASDIMILWLATWRKFQINSALWGLETSSRSNKTAPWPGVFASFCWALLIKYTKIAIYGRVASSWKNGCVKLGSKFKCSSIQEFFSFLFRSHEIP